MCVILSIKAQKPINPTISPIGKLIEPELSTGNLSGSNTAPIMTFKTKIITKIPTIFNHNNESVKIKTKIDNTPATKVGIHTYSICFSKIYFLFLKVHILL